MPADKPNALAEPFLIQLREVLPELVDATERLSHAIALMETAGGAMTAVRHTIAGVPGDVGRAKAALESSRATLQQSMDLAKAVQAEVTTLTETVNSLGAQIRQLDPEFAAAHPDLVSAHEPPPTPVDATTDAAPSTTHSGPVGTMTPGEAPSAHRPPPATTATASSTPPPPAILAPPPAPPPADHDVGWQYLYLASELERRLAHFKRLYVPEERGFLPPGERVTQPAADLKTRMPGIQACVAGVKTYLAADVVNRALAGDGNEEGVRYMAGGISEMYPALVRWANATRSVTVGDEWIALYTAMASMADAPLRELDEFVTKVRTDSAEATRAARAGAPFKPPRATLKLTIDDNSVARFDAAMAELKARRQGTIGNP